MTHFDTIVYILKNLGLDVISECILIKRFAVATHWHRPILGLAIFD